MFGRIINHNLVHYSDRGYVPHVSIPVFYYSIRSCFIPPGGEYHERIGRYPVRNFHILGPEG